jgi:hypothetical protein
MALEMPNGLPEPAMLGQKPLEKWHGTLPWAISNQLRRMVGTVA